jgi:hypothetical protein
MPLSAPLVQKKQVFEEMETFPFVRIVRPLNLEKTENTGQDRLLGQGWDGSKAGARAKARARARGTAYILTAWLSRSYTFVFVSLFNASSYVFLS